MDHALFIGIFCNSLSLAEAVVKYRNYGTVTIRSKHKNTCLVINEKKKSKREIPELLVEFQKNVINQIK